MTEIELIIAFFFIPTLFGLGALAFIVAKAMAMRNDISRLQAQIQHLQENMRSNARDQKTEAESLPGTELTPPLPVVKPTEQIPTNPMAASEGKIPIIIASEQKPELPVNFDKDFFEPDPEAVSEQPIKDVPVIPVITPAVIEKPIAAVKTEVRAEPRFQFSWEYFIGARLLAWIGGFTLFLGFCYFVKYAIDNNLITEQLRVAFTYLGGFILFGIGFLLRKKGYSILQNTLFATGILTFYLATWAGRVLYAFPAYSGILAGFLLVLTTLLALIMAVRRNSPVIAVLGVIGGFLTPFILSTGEDRTMELFAYVFSLNLVLIGLVLYRRWYYLVPLGIFGTIVIMIGWGMDFFMDKNMSALAVFLGLTTFLYTGCFIRDFCKYSKISITFAGSLVFGLFVCYIANIFVSDISTDKAALIWFIITLPLLAHLLLCRFLPGLMLAMPLALVIYLPAFSNLLEKINTSASTWLTGVTSVLFVLSVFSPALRNRVSKQKSGQWWLHAAIISSCLAFIFPFAMLSNADDGKSLYPVAFPFITLCILLAGLVCEGWRKSGWASMAFLLTLFFSTIIAREQYDYDLLWWYLAGSMSLFLFPYTRLSVWKNKTLPWLASAASLLLFYLVMRTEFLDLSDFVNTHFPSCLALVCSLPYLGGVIYLQKRLPMEEPTRRGKLALFAGVMIGFLTLAITEQFEKEWLTIAFALEGAALLWLNRKLEHRGLVITGLVLLFSAFIRFSVNKYVLAYHPSTGHSPWNWYLYSYILVAASCFAGAAALARVKDVSRAQMGKILSGMEVILVEASCFAGAAALERVKDVSHTQMGKILSGMGVILLFILMNIEIADYFALAGEKVLTFNFGNSLASDLTYSIGWAFFALTLLVVGIFRNWKTTRLAGIALLGITLLKVLTYDLSALEQLYRVSALVCLAIVALIVSFLYQKYSRVFLGKMNEGEDSLKENDS